jgi:3'(2'), 5'-bisphosphate nucleotidase
MSGAGAPSLNDDWLDDVALARAIADAAGRTLLDLRRSGLLAGEPLGDAGDKVANGLILAALHAHRPDDAILSEESVDAAARLSASRVWIVDPLDGTREYREGRDDWAVHVALSIDGVAAVGAVALPALGVTLDSGDPPPLAETPAKLRMLVSRTRPAMEAVAVAKALGAELVPMGSAGAKAMAVVRGEADIYLHTGGQYQWDNCAPAAVALAAGLHVSRVDGTPIIYNAADTYLPDLLICPKPLVGAIMSALAAI